MEADALFVRDGAIWTSAGTAAGIDLCLHLVRTARGAEAAATVARPMAEIAGRTGFGSEITMRQHFARHLATSPSGYRAAFARKASQPAGTSPTAA